MMHAHTRSRPSWSRAAVLVSLLALLTLALATTPARAAAPEDFQTSLVLGDGLNGPSGFEIAPDGRIFILERSGKIKIVKNGQLLPTPFADLPSEDTGDRGLIGIAFDPDFGVSNHYVYFYYTGHDLLNHLVRFSADQDVGTNGPFELFRTSSPSQLLHVGGSIRFGPDGKLYFAVGDNGYGPNAQDLSSPHGKILRINKDGSIPPDNPFAGQPGKLGAIWAYGMRNPWRFQFDSATGELYGGDVGDFTWEEVNHIVKGANYGWPLHEGACVPDCPGFVNPVYAYPHAGESSAVTGGPIYRGQMFPPEYQGDLFFGDYARGFIRNADLAPDGSISAVHTFDDQAGSVVDLKVAPDGSLYYITYWPGALYRVSYNTESHQPIAKATADVTKGIEPLTVNFSSAGSRDPDDDPVSFGWTFGDGTSSTEANPTHTFTEKGVYTVRLTVSANGETTPAQPIVIQAGIPPELTVASPVEGQLYQAGDTLTYNAFAKDGAGFDLNDAGITAEIRLHHGTHFHPFMSLQGRAGQFTIPQTGEPSADTSYEVKITATDANGLSTSKIINVLPRKSDITLKTDPPGLGVMVDGIPVSTEHRFTGVEGFKRELEAPNTAVAQDGTLLQFAGWSDGKSIRHVITTPNNDTTYTASYVPELPFNAKYYDNPTFSGTPVLTRQDAKIDFNWGEGSPDPAIPVDQFAVRWKKTQWFGPGRYKFTAMADDGVRLYIDGQRVLNQWFGPANTLFSYVAELGAGRHTIQMDFLERGGGAAAALSWDEVNDQPTDTYHAEYWNAPPGVNAIPATSPLLAREEDEIDHDWGEGSPGPGIGANRFVARWTRTMRFAPGDYDFAATADDGVRLYVDGIRVIDKWIDQGPTTYHTTLSLDGGPHTVVMEYYENGSGAVAKFKYATVADPPDDAGWHAEFWNNPDPFGVPSIPAGPADLQRTDDTLDFDWGEGSPGAGIAADRFVARWTKTVSLQSGLYRFSGGRDDGLRAYIDGTPVVDHWVNGNDDYTVERNVTGGQHELRVEYFESGGGARAEFTYERIGDLVQGDGGWAAQYFDNRSLLGTPVLTRTDDAVDFNWGGGAPGDGVPADNFSARWTKSVTLEEQGNYKFTATTDDGFRLFVDGDVVLDKWTPHGATTYEATRELSAGTHEIKLEYFEAGGDAVAKLSYAKTADPPPPPPEPWAAEYFGNSTLSGLPVLTRSDNAIDFDWGEGSPSVAVPVDKFSARWTRTKHYDAATYRFSVTADDGIRVLVDGLPVVDGWFYQAPTTYTGDVVLPEGDHTVTVEYFEWTVGAVAKYSESKIGPAP
jgi:glucose/arabinose dehydrogenase